MKLRIEPPESRKESYSDISKSRALKCHAQVLNFVMQSQKLSKWCWAAISASLEDYYGTLHLSQHEVASAILGFDCSSYQEKPEVAVRCNQYAMLDEALRLVGCYSHWSPGRPTFERIQAEIDCGRPVCPCIEWHSGGCHYVAVIGYYTDTGEIYIKDSLHGSSVQAFSQFPNTYRMSGGVWQGTFWTYPSASMNK